MFLRRLVIRGFKSFADRTVFDFSPGVSVIVGPNGSGKSNLVDAIAWVLGEQGAKTLRGGKMEDVIFAGTPKRPAVGRAEVELTIDNSSGVLPIEFSEVGITRTLHRSGDSEYAINGVPCRLLDIQELLSDSGIGRELHTIVGQGQLDTVLSGKPEERRAVIEEAAGLLKHRKRKDRAVRKLDRVDADIERLGDVIAELRRQIRPLERQAEIAQKAQQIEDELRELKLKLWVLDYRGVTSEEDSQAEARAQAEVEELSATVQTLTVRTDELEASLGATAREAETTLATEYRLAGLRDRYEALARFAEERRTHLEDLAAREPRDDAPSPDEIAAAEGSLRDAATGRAEAEAQARRAETERAAVQSAREEAARAREEIVHLNGERAALRAAVEAAEEEQRRLVDRRRMGGEHAAEIREQLGEVRTELERLDAEETSLGQRLEEAEGRVAVQRRLLADAETRARDAQRRTEALTDRCEMLREEVARLTDPVAALERASGIEGRALDQVRAQAGYERALRAALGPIADAVLASSRADAMAALERLKRHGGRASIAVPGTSIYAPVPVGVRPLLDVIDGAGPHADLIRGLLSGIALADSLAEAAELARAHPALVIVTIDGDRLGPNVVTGGSPDELRDAREDLRRTEEQLAVAADGLEAARREVEHITAELEVLEREAQALDEQMNALDARVGASTDRLAQLEREMHAADREEQVLAGRASEVEQRLGDDTEKLRAVESRLGRAVASEPEIDATTLAQIERMAAERSLTLGEATERERTAARVLTELRDRSQRIADARARYEADRGSWEAGARTAGTIADAARRGAERLQAWATQAGEARTTTEERRRALETELADVRRQRREAEGTLAGARDRAHERDLRRAERTHRVAALIERLRDEYQMRPDEALEAVSAEPDDADELRKRAATLDRRLGLLGRVNPIAMEQFQELKDRHQFLLDQVADLRKSRKDLMDVVEEVDRKIVEIFSGAFADVSREFGEVFDRLFPGGEGRVVLSEPDDLLNSGVEVEARPAGKRVKRVSLLSGGERSLVSVALLFSVFRARPSPFYLLDEVEAALDDVNLHRFLEIAGEFRGSSQLLIVTHQKRTMEIADALYGISMGGEGVSKVICERLDRVSEDASVDA